MNTVEFAGKVVAENGDVIFERVSGCYSVVRERSGLLDFLGGEFTVESGEPTHEFREGKLVTDDGKQGNISMKHVTFGSPDVDFQVLAGIK